MFNKVSVWYFVGQDPATSRGLPYGLGSFAQPGPTPPNHPAIHPSMEPYIRMASMFPPGKYSVMLPIYYLYQSEMIVCPSRFSDDVTDDDT